MKLDGKRADENVLICGNGSSAVESGDRIMR